MPSIEMDCTGSWWNHLMEMFKKSTLLFLSLQNISAVETISSIKACFPLSRNLLRFDAAGAEHCTAVFQEVNLLSSTAHSLLQSGQGPPAMPGMKGAPCTRHPTHLGSGKKAEGFRDVHYPSRLISQDCNSFEHCLQ